MNFPPLPLVPFTDIRCSQYFLGPFVWSQVYTYLPPQFSSNSKYYCVYMCVKCVSVGICAMIEVCVCVYGCVGVCGMLIFFCCLCVCLCGVCFEHHQTIPKSLKHIVVLQMAYCLRLFFRLFCCHVGRAIIVQHQYNHPPSKSPWCHEILCPYVLLGLGIYSCVKHE